MSQENVDLARSTYEAFAEGDIERVIAVFDPQIEWVEPEVPGLPESGTHRGSDAIVQNVFAPAETDWEEFAAEPNAYYDAGDVVVVTGTFRGRSKKGGGRMNAPFAHVLHMRDGKLVRFEDYFDTANELAAIRGDS